MGASAALRAPAGVLALGCALLACAGARVRSDYDREIDFSSYHTFGWLAPPRLASAAPGDRDPFTHNSLLDKRVRSAVEGELGARGYRRAEGGGADFRLDYHVIFDEQVVARAHEFGGHLHSRSGPFIGGVDLDVRQYPVGTLVLDVIDAERDQLVWRGWAVSRNRDGHYDEQEVRRAVTHILRRFPPGA